mmetsp:Transcript_9735/g.16195  ORF Transcript_9735/g.16195 Transcript_9735/m.16195 type:complete len:215 (-) Transcript_9735:713-1357(-)
MEIKEKDVVDAISRPNVDRCTPEPMKHQQPTTSTKDRKSVASANRGISMVHKTPNTVPAHPEHQNRAHTKSITKAELRPIHLKTIAFLGKQLCSSLAQVVITKPRSVSLFHSFFQSSHFLAFVANIGLLDGLLVLSLEAWASFIKFLGNLHKTCVIHNGEIVQELYGSVQIAQGSLDGISFPHLRLGMFVLSIHSFVLFCIIEPCLVGFLDGCE